MDDLEEAWEGLFSWTTNDDGIEVGFEAGSFRGRLILTKPRSQRGLYEFASALWEAEEAW